MRKSAKWMSVWDDRILEVMLDEESGSPTELANHDYIRVSQQHVSRRLKKLEKNNLVKRLGNAVYVITDEGEAYLREEYDVEDGVFLNQDQINNGTNKFGEETDT